MVRSWLLTRYTNDFENFRIDFSNMELVEVRMGKDQYFLMSTQTHVLMLNLNPSRIKKYIFYPLYGNLFLFLRLSEVFFFIRNFFFQ